MHASLQWWSPATDYARQNGGQYEWIIEKTYSLPNSSQFWDDLFFNSTTWGLHVYEQGLLSPDASRWRLSYVTAALLMSCTAVTAVPFADWLYNEVEGLAALTEDILLGRKWLLDMGHGAQLHDVHIQYPTHPHTLPTLHSPHDHRLMTATLSSLLCRRYCLSYPRHLLQSIEVPAVVQARSSRDYEPGNTGWDNWRVAESSLLLWALGLAPHKDTWWSTSVQPGNVYNNSEPDPALQAVIATLSTGPVMPGDAVGSINATLIRRSIRQDGLVMKPDRPAAYPDAVYVKKAWGLLPVSAYVTSTYTRHGQWVWPLLLEVAPAGGVGVGAGLTVREVLPWFARAGARAGDRYLRVSAVRGEGWGEAVEVGWEDEVGWQGVGGGAGEWELTALAPVLRATGSNVSVALMGDASKWVPMSAQRVREVRVDSDGVEATLLGSEGEWVDVWYWWAGEDGRWSAVVEGGCRVGQTGVVVWQLAVRDPSTYSCAVNAVRARTPLIAGN